MKNLLAILIALSAIGLYGCSGSQGDPGATGAQGAQGNQGDTGAQGPTGPTATASPTPVDANAADIADVLQNGAHGNAYREGLGQTELSPGLSCYVVHVSAGQCLSNSTADVQVPGGSNCVGTTTGGSPGLIQTTGTTYSYLYSGPFDQPNASSGTNNLIPTPLQSLFVNTDYKIVCTGYLVVQQPGWYEFEDTSDDGSIISTDSGTLYNDGNHGMNSSPITQSVYFTRDVHSFQVQYAQSGLGAFGLILTVNNVTIPSANMYH